MPSTASSRAGTAIGGRGQPSSAGRRRSSPRNSAAAASPGRACGTWPFSPRSSVRVSRRGHCWRRTSCSPAWWRRTAPVPTTPRRSKRSSRGRRRELGGLRARDEWYAVAAHLAATPAPDGYQLDGVKDRVEPRAVGPAARHRLTGEGWRSSSCPDRRPGVTVVPQWSLDLSGRFGEVRFDNVRGRSPRPGRAPGDEDAARAAAAESRSSCSARRRAAAWTGSSRSP